MGGKTFKNNPALQFISQQTEEPPERHPGSTRRKPTAPEKPPQGYKQQYVETKTKRVQIVLRPSLYDQVKAAAKKEKMSVNEFISQSLEIILEEV